MKLNIILCLAALFLVSCTLPIITEGDAPKVKVDFYFESLCPYCQQYIVGSLKKAAATKGFWDICEFNFYPYGNARRQKVGDTWTFTCQHGTRECQGNFVETCALKKYPARALDFLICLETNSASWTTQGQKCASQLDLDWQVINKCATSEEGVQYEVEMAQITQKLDPPHKYVPWVVVNGQHDQNIESRILSNMVAEVCHLYTGPKPSFC